MDRDALSQSLGRPETPLNEDALLGMTMLPSSGEGENIMKVFIQEHLTTILQPLAETVSEIQRSMRKIKDGTATANGMAERNQEHISSHEQKLVLFGAGLSRLNEDILNQKSEVQEALDKQVSIEGDLDLTKVSLSKMEGYVQSTANSTEDMRKNIDELDGRLRQTQLETSETKVYHMAFADRLSEVRNLHDGLNDRHTQMLTSLQQVRQSDENTRSTVKRHIGAFDKQKKDAQRSFTLIDDRLKSVEAMLLDTTHKTHSNAKGLKTMTNDLKRVLGEIGEIGEAQQGMGGGQSGTQSSTQDAGKTQQESAGERFGNRMGRMEESISQLHRSIQFDKDGNAARLKEIDDSVKKAAVEQRENTLQVDLATKTQKSHEERISRNDTRLTHAEGNIGKVEKIAEKADADGRALVVNFKELTSAIEFEKQEREKTNANLANTAKDIDAVQAPLQILNKDVLDMQNSMAKIGMRLELAHEYFQGTCKGFQDTHKRVTAGLDGMLPPKTVSNRKVLPDIPGSRPSSAMGGPARSDAFSPFPARSEAASPT